MLQNLQYSCTLNVKNVFLLTTPANRQWWGCAEMIKLAKSVWEIRLNHFNSSTERHVQWRLYLQLFITPVNRTRIFSNAFVQSYILDLLSGRAQGHWIIWAAAMPKLKKIFAIMLFAMCCSACCCSGWYESAEFSHSALPLSRGRCNSDALQYFSCVNSYQISFMQKSLSYLASPLFPHTLKSIGHFDIHFSHRRDFFKSPPLCTWNYYFCLSFDRVSADKCRCGECNI